jgi:hypothetical protein
LAHSVAEVKQEHVRDCDAVLSVGGDGTFLKIASRWQVRNNGPQYATGKADGKGGNPSFGKSFVGFGLEEGCPTL